MSHTGSLDLRENLKQEINHLSNSQLRRIANFIQLLKIQGELVPNAIPLWQRKTPSERAEELQVWAAQLPETYLSLSNQAFDRDSLYDR